MAGKSKVVSTGSLTGARGGSTKMFGKQTAGPKSPGRTGKVQTGSGGKFGKGGGTGHIGRQGVSSRVVPGRVSVSKR
jgi:hypothetical protein